MRDRISVPIKIINSERWGELSALSLTHDICGEVVNLIDEKFTLAGGHRVRLYRFKKNVHWRVPQGIELDISAVALPRSPPRKQAAKRHNKGR